MRWGFGGRLFGALCPLRSTVSRSSGGALRALKGIVGAPFGCAPLAGAIPPMRDRAGPPSDVPPSVATRNVVIVAPVGGPPGGIKSTIVTSNAAPSAFADKGEARIRTERQGVFEGRRSIERCSSAVVGAIVVGLEYLQA